MLKNIRNRFNAECKERLVAIRWLSKLSWRAFALEVGCGWLEVVDFINIAIGIHMLCICCCGGCGCDHTFNCV